MQNQRVLIGSIIFVFVSFIGMMALFVWETYKNKRDLDAIMAGRPAKVRVLQSVPTKDFSMYKTLIGGDEREMIEIPEGPFTMGVDDGDPDEGPAHPVFLQTFYIDLNEVTQLDYARFTKMTKRGDPQVPVFEDKLEKLMSPDFPVVGVTWNDAFGYCQWASKRLPTEAEWEKAARGEGTRRYPWGESFDHSFANVDGEDDGFKYLAPVGSFEVGRSPFGLYDATGNAAEWVMDDYMAEYYQQAPYRDPPGPTTDEVFKVIRGGSWRESRLGARVTKRFPAKMWRADGSVGFRCAKDPPTDM